jgi:hypothetical protein
MRQSTSAAPKVLQRDIYDALELSAEATGGLKSGQLFDWGDAPGSTEAVPVCLLGHAIFLDERPDYPYFYNQMLFVEDRGPALKELNRLGVTPSQADDAINHVAGVTRWRAGRRPRAPFAAVMQKLGIVRGDE